MPPIGPFLVAGLAAGSIHALSAVDLVVLFRATGVLNFAYGAIGALGAFVAWQMLEWNLPAPLAWLTCILLGMVLSLIYGRLIAPQLAYRETVVKAVCTLGYALILLGLSIWLWSDMPRSLRLPTDTLGFSIIGVRITGTRLLALILTILFTFGITAFLNRTRLGLQMRALANNRNLSAMISIPVLQVETWAWLISGFLAGVSGLFPSTIMRLDTIVLTFLVIPAIAAAIVGQLKSLQITLIGGLVRVDRIPLYSGPPVAPLRAMAPFVVAILVILYMQRNITLTFVGDD